MKQLRVEQIGIYLLKVNYRNTRGMHEICSKWTTETPKLRQWSCPGDAVVNFEQLNVDWVSAW